MTKVEDLENRFMEAPELRPEHPRVGEKHTLVEAMACAGTAAKPMRARAKRWLDRTQSAIARLEGGSATVVRYPAPPCRSDWPTTGAGPGPNQRPRGARQPKPSNRSAGRPLQGAGDYACHSPPDYTTLYGDIGFQWVRSRQRDGERTCRLLTRAQGNDATRLPMCALVGLRPGSPDNRDSQ